MKNAMTKLNVVSAESGMMSFLQGGDVFLAPQNFTASERFKFHAVSLMRPEVGANP